MQYRISRRVNPSFGVHYVVQRREFGHWVTVRHPHRKVMYTYEHAQNFLNIVRNRRPCGGCCGYC